MKMLTVYVIVPEVRKTWDGKEITVNVEHGATYFGVDLYRAFDRFRAEFPEYDDYEARIR